MQELVPFISCLVTPNEFQEALLSTYSEIYVDSHDGYLKHMKLRGGRHIRLKVDALPKNAVAVTSNRVEEEINFLPAGKISYEYFEQILHFFKEVMRLKNADYEAHAWILWSLEKGYYISVPKQTVSKASVQFSYDEETLPPDSTIVVDLHSHNTMGAFYSGTDNNNDKNGIYYSGVIGKLDTPNPQFVFRFNMHDVKRDCKLADVFDIPKKEVTIPTDWLDKVEVKATTPTYVPPQNYRRGPSLWDQKVHDITRDPQEYRRALGYDSRIGAGRCELADLIDDQVAELNEQAERHFGIAIDSDDVDPVGPIIGAEDDAEHSEDYDYYCVTYGKEAADAKDMIDACVDNLAECDEGLLDVIRSAYDLLSEKGQQELMTNGL